MQIAYIRELYEIMKANPSVMSVIADNGTPYDLMIASEMPDQYVNCGIAEENAMGVAAGLALSGKIPFIATSGAFLAYRAFEFLRNDVCYQNLNVKVIGFGSGLSISTLGPSHHTTEDLSILRALPNLTILCPSTPNEARSCIRLAAELQGPVYIRLGMSGEKELYPECPQIHAGGSIAVAEGGQIAIFAAGSIVSEAVTASEMLKDSGIAVSVFDMYSIKPLDEERVAYLAGNLDLAVTVEENTIIGGLGDAVMNVLNQKHSSAQLLKIGLNDAFARDYGTQEEVRKANRLDAASIAERIRQYAAGLKEDRR